MIMGSDPSLNGGTKLPKCRDLQIKREKKKRRLMQQLPDDYYREDAASNPHNNIVIKFIDTQAPIFLKADISSFRLLVQEFTGNNSINVSSASSCSPNSSHNHDEYAAAGHGSTSPKYSSSMSSASHPNSPDCHTHAYATATSIPTFTFDDYIGQIVVPSISQIDSCSCNPLFDFDIEPNYWQDVNRHQMMHMKSASLQFFESAAADKNCPVGHTNTAAALESAHQQCHGNPSIISGYGTPSCYSNLNIGTTYSCYEDQCYNLWDYI